MVFLGWCRGSGRRSGRGGRRLFRWQWLSTTPEIRLTDEAQVGCRLSDSRSCWWFASIAFQPLASRWLSFHVVGFGRDLGVQPKIAVDLGTGLSPLCNRDCVWCSLGERWWQVGLCGSVGPVVLVMDVHSLAVRSMGFYHHWIAAGALDGCFCDIATSVSEFYGTWKLWYRRCDFKVSSCCGLVLGFKLDRRFLVFLWFWFSVRFAEFGSWIWFSGVYGLNPWILVMGHFWLMVRVYFGHSARRLGWIVSRTIFTS